MFRFLSPQVLTREFRYVKPDRRLLLHVSQQWGCDPQRLLMVGDSFEVSRHGGCLRLLWRHDAS